MDFDFREFRSSSMPRGAALSGKDQDFESRRIKLFEEAIKIEQNRYKSLEQHDKKLFEILNSELTEISVFIPLYPEIITDQVGEIVDKVDRAGQTGQKRQREDGQKEFEIQSDKKQKIDLAKCSLKPDELIEEEIIPVEIVENERNTGTCTGTGTSGLNGLMNNIFEFLNGSDETGPDKNSITQKSEPIKDLKNQELESVNNSNSNTEKSEPVKNSITKESESFRELISKESEPVKESNTEISEPIKDLISKESEPVEKSENWELFTLGYWHCTLCKIKTLDRKILENHFIGRRHISNMWINDTRLITENSEPVKEKLLCEKSESVKELSKEKNGTIKKSEAVKKLSTDSLNSEPNKKLSTEKAEPSKKLTNEKLTTEKSKSIKKSTNEKSEPAKKLNEPVKKSNEPVKKSNEPVKGLVTVKSEHEPEIHLNKKQKLDSPNSPLLISNKSEKSNEERTSRISSYKESHKIFDKSEKNKISFTIHESMINYALFTKGYWHCTLCKIILYSQRDLESHFFGKRHKSNLINPNPSNPNPSNHSTNPNPSNHIKDLSSNPKPIPNPKPDKNLTEPKTSNSLNESPNRSAYPKYLDQFLTEEEFLKHAGHVIEKLERGYLCTICNLPFIPLGTVKGHLKGNKHRRNVEKMENGFGPGPVKKFVSEPFSKDKIVKTVKSRYEPITIYCYRPVKKIESGSVKE